MLLEAGHLRLSGDRGLEMGPLGAVRGGEGVLPAARPARGDVHRHAVHLLPDREGVDGRTATAAANTGAKALAITQVMPGDVGEDRHAGLADHEGASGLLHRPVFPALVQAGAHPCRRRTPAQPETEVEDGQPEIQHGAATGLVATLTPAELGAPGPEDVPAAPYALDLSQLAALHEAAHDLDIRPVAVIHPHHHYPIALLGGLDDPL